MRIISLLFIIIGVGMIGYSLYEYIPQLTIGQSGSEAVQEALEEDNSDKQTPAKDQDQNQDQPLYKERPKMDTEFGQLIIPKLEAVLPIVEGTDPDQLEKGVGHFAQSVLPGEADNSVLSGHRDTVFRKVGDLEVNDQLIVKTDAGTFTYQITKTWIVDADDRSVIVSHQGNHILTLTTCYPFDWIGSAPQRYIIQSKMIQPTS